MIDRTHDITADVLAQRCRLAYERGDEDAFYLSWRCLLAVIKFNR